MSNHVLEEIKHVEEYIRKAKWEDFLEHYGMPRRSGRYPWGSGENPNQHGDDFISRIEEMKRLGWKETPENIEKTFGMKTTEYRMQKAIANDHRRLYQMERARSLKEDGLGNTEIGKIMGKPESTIRSYLNENSVAKAREAADTADFLAKQVNEKKMVDVGVGIERELGISRVKLDQALQMLKNEGYNIYSGGVAQITNKNQQTIQKVLTTPDKQAKDIYDFENVKSITDYTSHDDGKTFVGFQYPASMSSKRLGVRYAEEGGLEKDGLVELRRGVPDLDLGPGKHYSQVRIMVDNKKYIKGMAIYSDDLPDGVDVMFNTNKSNKMSKLDVLKDIKEDPDNPFGSLIKANGQSTYIDKDGKTKLSLINKRADEGDWSEWQDKVPSQFLSKQPKSLAKKQLDLASSAKDDELNDILSLDNPTIKKKMLLDFADGADKAAVSLQAAAFPGQKYHVIVPIPALKDTEVYAPKYENGTKLALVRYPHGGTFEIPIVTVNNKHAVAKKVLGPDIADAVGINSKVAERLSGADFDGDTVMCIPTHDSAGKVKITSSPPLEGLKNFDPKMSYGPAKIEKDADGNKHYYDQTGREYPIMKNTGTQMGSASNLITDMTLKGATNDELARAVRHSMVVIDAEKHKLDYKKSEIDNNIKALKKRYQGSITEDGNYTEGASTLISRSKGQYSVDKRQGNPKINVKGKEWYDPTKPEGANIYTTTSDLYYPKRTVNKEKGTISYKTTDGKRITYSKDDPDAKEKYTPVKVYDKATGTVKYTNKAGDIEYALTKKTQQSTRMAETDDARSLISTKNTPMENLYADYANHMKSLANNARLEYTKTGNLKYDAEAHKTYANEVKSLNEKLNVALLNAPKERQAQLLANAAVASKKKESPNMTSAEEKKEGQKALEKYRAVVGAKRTSIDITDNEWEAIQKGAVSEATLTKILNNTDADKLKARATPRATTGLSAGKQSRLKSMHKNGYTIAEIAKALGVSASTIERELKGGK